MLKFYALAGVASGLLLSSSGAFAVETGLYAGPGCWGVDNLPGFAHWLGEPATHVTENFNQSTWSALESDALWSIECYDKVRDSVSMTFSIPMLPESGGATLAEGAEGKFDGVFETIAEELVSHGFPDTIVRIGWEFNGNWQPWSSYKDNTNFIRYFQRIVTVMRKVSGAHFAFEWCPNLGIGTLPPSDSYPGDEFVDVIGMDVYDQHWSQIDRTPQGRWTYTVNRSFGLRWQMDFAKEHDKRLSWPEWGCCGDSTGDDPYFINQAAMWMRGADFLYASYWDNNTAYEGELSNGQFPKAAAAFIEQFGKR
jgi:hypothetical protein